MPSTAMASEVEELPESKLGTKAHWDAVYAYVARLIQARGNYVRRDWRRGRGLVGTMAYAGSARTVSSGW